MLIRPEQPADYPAVRQVNLLAFDGEPEANLVEALRRDADPVISLVAEDKGEVVGHIMFSPVSIDGAPPGSVMGLAPMAVAPERQRQGIGTALVRAGIEACRSAACRGIVVLGHPDFYPRFGFKPASVYGLKSEYVVPDEAFMALPLGADDFGEHSGIARYHTAFATV